MVDRSPPNEFDNINSTVGEEWESETTPYERVRQIIAHTYAAVSASTVADDAQTSPTTARKHLNALADEGFVVTATGEHGGVTYRRSPKSLVVEQAADILEHVSMEELHARIAEMREQLIDYQREYDVDSPKELTIKRTNETLSGSTSEKNEIDANTIQEWQTTRRNLAFANAALSIANAQRFVDDDLQSSDESALA